MSEITFHGHSGWEGENHGEPFKKIIPGPPVGVVGHPLTAKQLRGYKWTPRQEGPGIINNDRPFHLKDL